MFSGFFLLNVCHHIQICLAWNWLTIKHPVVIFPCTLKQNWHNTTVCCHVSKAMLVSDSVTVAKKIRIMSTTCNNDQCCVLMTTKTMTVTVTKVKMMSCLLWLCTNDTFTVSCMSIIFKTRWLKSRMRHGRNQSFAYWKYIHVCKDYQLSRSCNLVWRKSVLKSVLLLAGHEKRFRTWWAISWV